MKCPRCKYSTFEYFDMCPRCGKDMATEKTKLNIFSVKPNPPYFLGSLTGDLSDSDFDTEELSSIEEGAESKELKNEEVYDDGLDLNINIDGESVLEPDKGIELHEDAMDISSQGNELELELDFNSDAMSLEIEEETVKLEGINKKASLEKNVYKKSDQKVKPTEVEKEIYLEPEDLKISLDSDED